MILITEDISYPIDEGIKKYSFKLAQHLAIHQKASVFTYVFNKDISNQQNLPQNKLFFSYNFFKSIRKKKGIIVYVPNGSSTFFSFLRLKILEVFSSKPTVFIGIQKRQHTSLQKTIIKFFLKPKLMFIFSLREKNYYKSLGIKTEMTSIGVNTNKYVSVNSKNKLELRTKLNLPLNKNILLHVGHINKGRNISVLKALLNQGYEVIVIGSTCFNDDNDLKHELVDAGINIVSHYIDKINEYYQAVDAYVFPVLNDNSVIEFPLSILEAMSCNLPILTTPFGSIPFHFKETDFFRYFNDEESLITESNELFKMNDNINCNNAKIIMDSYSWEKQFEILYKQIENL